MFGERAEVFAFAVGLDTTPLTTPTSFKVKSNPVDVTTQLRSIPMRSSRPTLRWLFPVFTGGEVLALEGRRLEGKSIAIGRAPGRPSDVQLDDPAASRSHAEVRGSATGPLELVDLDSRNGTELDGTQIEQAKLHGGAVIRIGDSLLVVSEVDLPAGVDAIEDEDVSPSWAVSCQLADVATRSSLPVLIVGPTGSGKELLAQRVGKKSGRTGPLLPINCGAMASELLASELFGHACGAYTGAQTARPGLFVSAHGGTLFLDEIGELPLDQQPALLRVLQEGRVRPVGSDRERPVDVRIVAATHRDLGALIEEGRFRRDLYHRLGGFEVKVDGLARRREDILRLFSSFAPGGLEPDAAKALLLYAWPGNVRELKAVAQQASLLAGGGRIELAHMPASIREDREERERRAAVEGKTETNSEGDPPSTEELERLLKKHHGNVASVGRDLGRHRQQVYRWLRRCGLDPSAYRGT